MEEKNEKHSKGDYENTRCILYYFYESFHYITYNGSAVCTTALIRVFFQGASLTQKSALLMNFLTYVRMTIC